MPTPIPEPVIQADCPRCGYPGLMRVETGDMFPHRVKGSSRGKICAESESIKRPAWERHG